MNKAELREIASRQFTLKQSTLNQKSIESSVAYLASEEALTSIEADPYWPKWNSPWWHCLLLFELGEAKLIPRSFLEKMVAQIDSHYLKFFPFYENEIPAGKNASRHIMCHCALGSVEQVCHAGGINLAEQLPWVRDWYLKYQLPDGGLNCDEAAYTRATKKSSVVSTLPCLEAVLHCRNEDWSDEEKAFLQRGAKYLLERRLFRSMTSGEVIDKSWLKLTFPRFYFYDVLRGLNFLLSWSGKTRSVIPISSIAESVQTLSDIAENPTVSLHDNLSDSKTWNLAEAGNLEAESLWVRVDSSFYPLLDEVRQAKVYCQPLMAKLLQALRTVNDLLDEDLIS